ncbi:MAG: ribulose-phosphate 3-epimerase [Bacteroidota bacterium]
MAHYISPSILSADFGKLKEQIELLNQSEADFIHIDVMDGVFVPNISFGFTIIDAIAKHAKKPLDIHLMIIEPNKYIEQFASYNPEYLSVHMETTIHLNRIVNLIKSFGVKAAVAVNPHTSISMLDGIILDADMILIMSVNPGFGGQKFIQNSLSRIQKTKEQIISSKSNAIIEVDGGIDMNNIKSVINAGADIIVAGNSVFMRPDIIESIKNLKNIIF